MLAAPSMFVFDITRPCSRRSFVIEVDVVGQEVHHCLRLFAVTVRQTKIEISFEDSHFLNATGNPPFRDIARVPTAESACYVGKHEVARTFQFTHMKSSISQDEGVMKYDDNDDHSTSTRIMAV